MAYVCVFSVTARILAQTLCFVNHYPFGYPFELSDLGFFAKQLDSRSDTPTNQSIDASCNKRF